MNFNNSLPEWKNTGTEPSDSLKNDGFKAGYKPSANVFNWFWSLVSKCITEIQSKLSNEETARTEADKNLQQPTFTEASTRVNIASGETLSTLFGKIKKFFADLKTVAFTGSYTDLSNKPTSMQNPNSLTLTMNGSATSYNGASSASKSWYAPTSAGTSGYEMVSNGSGAPVWKPPSYAVCSTSGNTAVKTVSISNFKLTTGVRVLVKFTYEHTSSTAATLNVNSTGAKNIVVHCGTEKNVVKTVITPITP